MVDEPGGATVFIVDPHSIFRLGMTTCLASLSFVNRVRSAETVAEARTRESELARADLVIVDAGAPGMLDLVRELSVERGTACLASGSAWNVEQLTAILDAGAVGVLAKESLTPATLEANVRATFHGTGVLPSDLMARVLGSAEAGILSPVHGPASQLSAREQDVLRLIADGHATREVAAQLCYSERTIKNVLHDVATKLGARSRSHAVAHAVRAGLI
jgi:DNA-binding NarL/FixJ family response regulator